MGKNGIGRKLSEYNSILKENEDIYRMAAKKLGLPDGAFWILYTLREANQEMTQSEVCHAMYQPKQTVNSALKKLEHDGIIELLEMKDKRSKRIHLTEKGERLARETVDKVIAAEQRALSDMEDEEQEVFFALLHKFTKLLQQNIMTEVNCPSPGGGSVHPAGIQT